MKRSLSSQKRAAVSTAWLVIGGSIALLLVLAGLVSTMREKPGPASKEPLVVYCAAGIRGPVEAVARQYEKEFGAPVQLQFGGSQTLLANLEISKTGDLYIPADESYLELAHGKALTKESVPLAQMHAVLAAPKGNPKRLTTLSALTGEGVKLAQANPDAAAIGKIVRTVLQKSGQWDAVAARTLVFTGTVNDAANAVKLGTVDGAFIWDAMSGLYPELETVELPELAGAEARISVAVLASAKEPAAALRFARYLGARDKGLPEFKRAGYEVVEGDKWAVLPDLRLLSGSVLRPAIDDTIVKFEQREGVAVTRVYNGCGILVAQMRAGEHPDAYFACDNTFMTQVNDLFLPPEEVSSMQLVILVPKGNPHGIRTLRDFGKPGLRVGIGHEQQCAMGALTKTTLLQGGVYAQAMKNVVVQTPTGDLLVNQLRTGSLDAVIAYLSNAAGSADVLEALPINIDCATAIQPVAIGKESDHKQLTRRLLETLTSAQSRERFEAFGFDWREGSPPAKAPALPLSDR